MRDILAGLVALALLGAAASLATTLKQYRRRRQRGLDAERALGRTIVAEIPGPDDLMLFSEDDKRFYYADRPIDKDLIVGVRLLINGAAIASYVSARGDAHGTLVPAGVTSGPDIPSDVPETFSQAEASGIARDKWDVAIDTITGTTVLVACGAIRERVSQDLARSVFSAVTRDLERRDAR